MNSVLHRESFAFSARVLGALFWYAPDSAEAAPLVTALSTTDWAADWPLSSEQLQPVVEILQAPADEPLPEAWQRLFIGPYALPAPPWGSVWLDRESVLFGDSTLALRQWMRDNAITVEAQQNEPEDHFGTLLMLAAWLSENGHDDARDALLAEHLLPWSQRFLSVLEQEAKHPFYSALAQLARLTLESWRTALPVPVAKKPLYR